MKKLHLTIMLLTLSCLLITNKLSAQNYTVIEPGPEHYASKASSSKSSITPIIKANTNNSEQLNKVFNLSGNRNVAVPQATVNCYIPPDGTYQNFPGNDDGSIGPIPLPFAFSLYGTNYTSVYINNNGNLTFTGPSNSFDPVGFPTNTPMVAPFWADVDTRVGNTVKYKVSPTNLIVTWPGVGYYNQNISKLNTFQVVITNGNDPLIGLGNNVAFYYGDMQWTTGEASSNGGSGGFGGVPATAGINKGDGINFIQIGRFNQNNTNYGGPLSGTSGISYLDFSCYPLTAGSLTNLQPAVSGLPVNNTVNIACGETGTINLTALPPEVGQNVSVVVNTGGLCNTTVNTTSGTSSNATVSIVGAACNVGSHNISFVFTDNFNPSASTTINITVVIGTVPIISCPANITVSNATGQCGANVTYPTATATGTSPSITYSIPSGSFFPVGTTAVTATATNSCGSDSCTFTVTVNDTQEPSIYCPANISVNASSGTCGAVVTYNLPTVLENCSTIVAGSQTFNYTGATETFTVPAGVNSINIQAWGAQGGNLSSSFCTQMGALGGMASGSLSVNPGDVIYVNVGQQGQLTNAINAGYSPNAFNGGGKGWTWNSHYGSASSGGGASDLRVGGNSLNNRVIVAGGAGGGTCNGCIGGTGGGLIGGSGGCSGGNGGTQIAGGTGGVSGSFGNGGDANSITTVGWTGGGGGGWYGGASGTSHLAGGGGSSYIGGVTNGSTTSGVRSGNGQIIISWTANTAPIPIQTSGLASGATYPVGTTTNTFTATDAAGNSSTCSFTVTVNDTQAPTISCPANISGVVATSAAGAIVNYTAPIGTDNCPGATTIMTAGLASGATFPIGTTTVSYQVTDAAGLTAQCSFNVTVVGVPPQIVCPANIIVNNDANKCGAIINFTATETVGIPASTISYSPASGSLFPVGTTTVTATATNTVGSSSCTFTVTVNDTQPPSLAMVPSAPYEYDILGRKSTLTNINLGGTGTNVARVAPSTSVNLSFNRSTVLTGACPGCITQHYIGIAGVWASQCLFSTTSATNGSHSFTFTAPSTPGVYYITITGSWEYSCIPVTMPSGPSSALAVVIVGNASSCPENVSVNNDPNQCGAIVSRPNPSIVDNCLGGSVVQTAGLPSGSLYPIGTTTNTFVATDAAGNTASCSYTVTVNDTQTPSIVCAPTLIISNTPGLCTGTATLVAPTVTDNCAVAPQLTTNGSFASGSDNWNQCGNNVEAYGTEASYGGSNPFNAVAEIDHEPVTLCQNINGFVVGQTYQLTFRASRRLGAPPTVGTVITIDGGALNTTVSRSNNIFSLTPETISFVATQTTHQLKFEPSAGWGGTVGFIIDDIAISRQFITNNAPPTFGLGDTVVTWTATDASGNTTTCTQTVTVNDTEAPSINCPGNITVNNTTNQCGANVSFAATASDNCGTANITYSPASGSFFAVGTTSVTATADDGHGNTTSCTFTVTVNDTQPPTISCPANIDADLSAGQCGAFVSFAATASDNCGTANITYSHAPGSLFVVGTTTVTATADDGHGNTTSCTFTVTVDLLDHVNLQWPPNAAICPGGSFTAYGQVYEPNVTTVNGQQGANIEVQFGYNSSNTNPSTWSNWYAASYNSSFNGNPNNDEYFYNFSSNIPGTYYYTFRYRQNGCAWQYGGFQQWDGGTWDGSNYVSGVLTVQALDWANLQWPPNATICQGSSMTAYGQVYEAGVTPGAGSQGAGIDVQFGYSSTNTNPSGWSNWTTASFNQFGGGFANDEYFYNFTPPSSGTYYYTFRYRLNGCAWQYGGYSSGGGLFWDGTNFVNGTLNVSPTTVGGVVSGGTSICPGETSALLTLSNYTGMIIGWESATAPFLSWNPIGNNNNTYTSGPLFETTKFRAIVQSGVCPSMASAETTVVVYLTYPFYADNDEDGYGAGPSVLLCSDDANNAPEGYSVDGTDCDDTLADRHETFPFYVDADGDGYGAEGSTAVQLCAVDGNTPPLANYSVNDEDCNDLVFAINPSVAEIPFDNIDNNCNGTLYDGHPLIVVNVLSPSCGGINHGLNNTINCTEIYLGEGYVIGYRFKVTNLSTGQVDYVDTVQHHFKLTDTDIYAYGTSYSIQVAAIVNGEVQGYNGNTCTLTTTNVATTKVVNSQCGSTLLFMNSTINANAVNSAIAYRFRVARADAPTTYYYTGERNVPNFNLTMLTVPVGFLTYATEYKVDVQIKIKLANVIAWSQFGQVCSIFTPEPPTSSVIASQCELVASSYTQVINATPFAGATLYRFLLTHYDEFGELDYEQYQDSPTPSFTLSMFTGLLPDTTYNVAVSMLLYGTYVPYDKECSITTPMAARIIETTAFKATVYPNPYSNNFRIDVTTADTALIEIKVYDMVGRLVEQKTVKVSDLEKAPIGERYPSGVYNVVVSQGENIQTVRVVRR